jgi:hypothetical protein
MEALREFAVRLSRDVDCFYHTGKSETYSLKKYNTNLRGRMGVFAWIRELRRNDQFEVSTYKILGDKCHVTVLADKIVPGMHFIPKGQDDGEGTGIVFYVKNKSSGADYSKTAQAMRAILQIK